MGRVGAWFAGDQRQVRNDATRDWSATGLISFARSLMNPATSSVRAFACFFAASQLVGEPTEGRQEGIFLPPSLARPAVVPLSAEPRSRQLRGPALPSRIVGTELDWRIGTNLR